MGLEQDNKYHLKWQSRSLGSFAPCLPLKPFGKLTEQPEFSKNIPLTTPLVLWEYVNVFSVTSVSDKPAFQFNLGMFWVSFNRQSWVDGHDLNCQDPLRPQLCSVKQKINYCDWILNCKLVTSELAQTTTTFMHSHFMRLWWIGLLTDLKKAQCKCIQEAFKIDWNHSRCIRNVYSSQNVATSVSSLLK